MVKVTVLLVRDAETVMEARRRADPDFDEQLDDETVNDDLKAYISDQAGDEAGHGEDGTMTLSERVDPDLADERAYEYAQNAMTDLMNALAKDGNERKLAYFSAPNRSCAATALMMSCADIKNHEHLTWRLSTFEGASAPASIPIVVSNGLCNAEPQAMRLGGYKATVEGGLMHCAAMPFNDGRTKCPLMKGACADSGGVASTTTTTYPMLTLFCSFCSSFQAYEGEDGSKSRRLGRSSRRYRKEDPLRKLRAVHAH